MKQPAIGEEREAPGEILADARKTGRKIAAVARYLVLTLTALLVSAGCTTFNPTEPYKAPSIQPKADLHPDLAHPVPSAVASDALLLPQPDDAQKAARVDALRTEVRIGDLKQQLLQEQNVLEVAHRFLATLLGRDSIPSAGLKWDDFLLLPDSLAEVDATLDRGYRQRHDYAAAASALEAQAKRVDSAEVRLPELPAEGVAAIDRAAMKKGAA